MNLHRDCVFWWRVGGGVGGSGPPRVSLERVFMQMSEIMASSVGAVISIS